MRFKYMGCSGHSARAETIINEYEVFKFWRKPYRGARDGHDNNSKIDFKEIGFRHVSWIQLAQES
jgi:hypothetical protein